MASSLPALSSTIPGSRSLTMLTGAESLFAFSIGSDSGSRIGFVVKSREGWNSSGIAPAKPSLGGVHTRKHPE